jgi:arylsulfatase A-like enzyme
MTGLWPARLGITTPSCHMPEVKLQETVVERAPPSQKILQCQSATRLSTDYSTLAKSLREAGYRTGHFGKWHLGREPYDPLHQGFDVDVPHTWNPGPPGCYLAPWHFPDAKNFQGQPGEHIEDRMAQEAIRFLRENKDRPFYLNYWAFSVHGAWDAKDPYIEKYRRKADPNSPQRNPVYAGMVQSLDENVGRLLDTIDELGLAQRTIIVFFSDNGGVHWAGMTKPSPHGAEVPPDTPITSNAPLRGGKGTIYEGGTREPCIVAWPGQTPAGSKSDAIIQSIDFYPTILDMLGLKPPAGQKFDGVSIVPALRQSGPVAREAIFCYFPHITNINLLQGMPSVYVRQGDWKLIRIFYDGPMLVHRYELYNLKDDVGETRDLSAQMPEKVKQLDRLIDRFLAESGAVLPKPNPSYNPLVGPWEPNKETRLSVRLGRLILETSKGNPTIATRDVPAADGEMTLEFRMRSTAKGGGRAFWTTTKGKASKGFNAEHAVRFAVTPGGQWHEYAEKLPVRGTISALRFDPAGAPGHVEVEWIRLKTPDGRLLKEWKFDGSQTSPAPSRQSQQQQLEFLRIEG